MRKVTSISPEVRADAAAWLARIRSDSKTVADEKAFRQWLAGDPSHVAAFESMTEIWETMGAARRRPAEPVRTPALVSRRQLMAASAAAVAVTGASIFVYGRAGASVYETGIGEQHHVVLPDGTQAFLDTATRLTVRIDGNRRLVDLECGRCNFDVVPDARRPFMVGAADERIVAGRTALDVMRDDDRVSVTVLRGTAVVLGGPIAAENPCTLKAGQRVRINGSAVTRDTPDLTRVLAWQTGQVVFDKTELSEAVRELNRYSVVRLEADPAVAHLRISGVFRVGDNAAFAGLMAELLPVTVQTAPNRILFMSDTARTRRG